MKFLPQSPLAQPKRLDYGWVIIFIAAMSTFFSAPGQTYFISGFIDIYVNELSLDRSTVSTLYSLATLISGLVIFMVGKISDRLGIKRTMLAVGFLLGLTCFWNSFNTSIVTVFVGFFFGRFLGQGSMTFLPALLLPNWFYQKRAVAFSLMSVGGVVASSLVPLINAMLLGTLGWRIVWRVWGIALWILFLPLVYFFMFNRPKDIGKAQDFSLGKIGADDDTQEIGFTPRQAMGTFAFWGMTFCQMVLPLVGTGITFHMVSLYATKGLSAQNAALSLSLIALVSFPVTLLAGQVMDRLRQHHVAALVSLIELAALLFLFFANSLTAVLIFSALHGIAMGIQAVNNGIVWPDYFGTKHLGVIRGYAMTGTVIASAVGPLPLGIIFGLQGDYGLGLLLFMALPATAFVVALFSKKPVQAA
ncbi:MAG: MFS transporter [Clostridiales bacterium]|nr:MFS transporter [Clostridiales bacterium]